LFAKGVLVLGDGGGCQNFARGRKKICQGEVGALNNTTYERRTHQRRGGRKS